MASKNARLVDAIGQLQMWLIIGLAYGAFAWWLYQSKPSLQEIETKVKNAATKEQVEALTNEVRTLEQRVIERLRNPESWQKTKSKIMDRSTQFLELLNN